MKDSKIIRIEKEKSRNIRNKILVNLITFIRSLGTIAIVPVFILQGAFVTALATIGFFATDFIDGFLARRLHVQTFFGSLLDSLSDKSFGIVCLLLLSSLNPIFLSLIALELGITIINYKSAQRGNNVKSSIAGKAKTVLLAISMVGSFFCYGAPTLKSLLNYINVTSFNKLLELNPTLLSSILALPAIGAGAYVAYDYNKNALLQDGKKIEENNSTTKEKLEFTDEKNLEDLTISEIHQKKKSLLEEQAQIIKVEKELKSRAEIFHDLFDTEFYLQHKDDGIKQLLYK